MTFQEYRGIKAVSIARLSEHIGEEVLVQGWLYNKRGKGKLHFLQVRDGSGIVQVVASKNDLDEESFEACKDLTQESSLRVIGKPVADERAPSGVELQPTHIEIVSIAKDYPITKKEHGPGFLMEHRHLWLRSNKQMAVMRIRNELLKGVRDFFYERGFALMDSPIFTPNACEGTSTLFATKYFEDMAYLTQSGQLYAEASAMALGKVYCLGPTFRAEKSKTRRHLTEFWMVEPEAAFYDLDDVMQLAEDFLIYLAERCLERSRADLLILERDVAALEMAASGPYPRISYDEAADLILESGDETFKRGDDFGAPHETFLSERFDKPVMVHTWPAEIKAFYMKRDPDKPNYVKGVDVIARGAGEIIGGAQREDDLELLEQRIRDHDLPMEAFSWYLDLRRYGSVPHGGFGLGIERALSWISGVSHVRETIPFPRMLDRLHP